LNKGISCIGESENNRVCRSHHVHAEGLKSFATHTREGPKSASSLRWHLCKYSTPTSFNMANQGGYMLQGSRYESSSLMRDVNGLPILKHIFKYIR
jgi:hypothetical protein